MTKVLSAAGMEFLRAFGVGVLTYGTGILAAPNLNEAYLLGTAALFAILAGAFRAIQRYVSFLTFAELLPQPFAAWVDAFARAALSGFSVSLIGWLDTPDLATWRSAGLAAVVGALGAGMRALQGLVSKDESPLKGKGAPDPDEPPTPPEPPNK